MMKLIRRLNAWQILKSPLSFELVYVSAAQNFWGLIPLTPNLRMAQIVKVYQVPGPSVDVLPRFESSENVHHRPDLEVCGRLQSSPNVVKHPWRDLKLGIPSQFGPISSLEFEE